jgi:uncharacterized protein (TIGR02145 family)
MKTQILILLILISPTGFAQIGYIKDIEGNKYRFSEFGKQELMLDNLCATKYQNGDPIPLVPGNSDWRRLSTIAYCNYNNNEENGKTFGRLYNYLAIADKRNLCPSGWHVPSVEDWIKLEEYAKTENGNSINLYILSTKEDNSNTYGGSRGIKGWFFNLGKDGEWWSATSSNKNKAWCSYLLKRGDDNYSLVKLAEPKYVGLSVRCMRDTSIWTKVTMDTTIKTLKEYLAIYPQGKHVEEAYLILQDRFGIPSPSVLPHFNPSLTGYKNTVFVERDTVGKNGGKMVVLSQEEVRNKLKLSVEVGSFKVTSVGLTFFNAITIYQQLVPGGLAEKHVIKDFLPDDFNSSFYLGYTAIEYTWYFHKRWYFSPGFGFSLFNQDDNGNKYFVWDLKAGRDFYFSKNIGIKANIGLLSYDKLYTPPPQVTIGPPTYLDYYMFSWNIGLFLHILNK